MRGPRTANDSTALPKLCREDGPKPDKKKRAARQEAIASSADLHLNSMFAPASLLRAVNVQVGRRCLLCPINRRLTARIEPSRDISAQQCEKGRENTVNDNNKAHEYGSLHSRGVA